MSSDALGFRPATADDAAELTSFGERIFRRTFGPDNTAEDMDLYCREAFTVERQRRELVDPDRHTLLAVIGGELAGYAQLVAGPPPELVTGPDAIELLRFYVDVSWHGRGLAQALMARTVAAAAERRALTLYLGVWDRNHRAIAFYLRQGFARVGSRPFVLGHDRQIDELMARPVRAPR